MWKPPSPCNAKVSRRSKAQRLRKSIIRPKKRSRLAVRFRHAPVDPADFVVLAVSVVVALLRATDLVARQQHWHAVRNQQDRGEVLALPHAQRVDAGIVARPLDAAVPAVVVVGAIGIILAVGEVVLLVVRNQVGQREAVMAGDEVDAVIRFARAGFSTDRDCPPAVLPAPTSCRHHPSRSLRMSSRYLPFHSAQRPHEGNVPTW